MGHKSSNPIRLVWMHACLFLCTKIWLCVCVCVYECNMVQTLIRLLIELTFDFQFFFFFTLPFGNMPNCVFSSQSPTTKNLFLFDHDFQPKKRQTFEGVCDKNTIFIALNNNKVFPFWKLSNFSKKKSLFRHEKNDRKMNA